MADKKDLQRAKKIYETLCNTLIGHDLDFEKDDKKLEVECGIQGEDLPMTITIKVDVERHLIMLLSHLPFVISEDKRVDVAVAVSVVNNMLVDGSFDYDVKSGHMFFRMTNSFLESDIGEEALTYLLFCSCQTIDTYNDKFFMISKDALSLEQFISDNC